MQAVLDSYDMNYSDMDYIMVRTNWTEMTITQVDLLLKDDTASAMGDVNLDGEFDVADVVSLQKWLLSDGEQELKSSINGDFCSDGILDVFDLCAMKENLLKSGEY